MDAHDYVDLEQSETDYFASPLTGQGKVCNGDVEIRESRRGLTINIATNFWSPYEFGA